MIRVAAVLLWVTLQVDPPEELRPGLVGEYFAIAEEMEDFPSLGKKKPRLTRIDAQINFEITDGAFAGTELKDLFCVRWHGYLRVPRGGKYTFSLESDDGSRLYIDDRQVVDNGGLHAFEEKTGKVELSKGLHRIRVEFFENWVGAGCRLYWEADGLAKAIVPAETLFHSRR